MKHNTVETIIGFLVIIIACLFLKFAYNARNLTNTKDLYTLTARFQSVDGLSVGSDVSIAGINIGYVSKLTLDMQNFYAIASLSINSDIKLPKDSRAAVSTVGLIGGKFIAITPGVENEVLLNNDQIKYTQSAFNIESLVGKLMYSIGNK